MYASLQFQEIDWVTLLVVNQFYLTGRGRLSVNQLILLQKMFFYADGETLYPPPSSHLYHISYGYKSINGVGHLRLLESI